MPGGEMLIEGMPQVTVTLLDHGSVPLLHWDLAEPWAAQKRTPRDCAEASRVPTVRNGQKTGQEATRAWVKRREQPHWQAPERYERDAAPSRSSVSL